jgi:hypothetical protein
MLNKPWLPDLASERWLSWFTLFAGTILCGIAVLFS